MNHPHINNYYPFGLKHKGYNNVQNGRDHKYGFNGKEEQDDNLGGNQLNWHDFGARNYDAALGRWMNLDPLAEAQYDYSLYSFTFNNPIMFNDPSGMIGQSPIYGTDGTLLGTDDKGLQGEAIVMNKEDFQQSMSHEEAKEKDLGKEGLKDEDAKQKQSNSFKSLKSRPDYDGKITLSEANKWFRNGNKGDLYADMSKMDLKFINESGFESLGDNKYVSSFLKSDDGWVYGSFQVKNEGNQEVSSVFDNYDFNRHNNRSTAPSAITRIEENAKRGFRNFATFVGRVYANKHPINTHNNGFKIKFYGKGKISK